VDEPLHVPDQACASCHYRRDTPPGIWQAEEYEKLRAFDQDVSRMEDPTPALSIFLCHQSEVTGRETVCRGWLSVHRDSVAVRILKIKGGLRCDQVPHEPEPLYYATGTEACEAGLSGVEQPSREARHKSDTLERQRANLRERS